MINIRDCGAVGDGKTDDFSAIMRALSSGEEEVFFPKGIYTVSGTVLIPSHRTLRFEEGAVLKLNAETPRKRGDFLLDSQGTEDICILGGTLDGNNRSPYHKRPKSIFQEDGYSGVLINFYNVRNLRLQNVRLVNPVAYFTRFCRVEDFLFENITLSSQKFCPNQDGIHLSGFCRNGVVRNVRVETYGQSNDDFLALNADDFENRIEVFDTDCGSIENVLFENIFAESCHSAVRLLSFRSAIKNVTFRRMDIGFRNYAVNACASRDCRTHLFREEDYPQGVGELENIIFEDCTFRLTTDYPIFGIPYSYNKQSHPFMLFSTHSDTISFRNCRFVKDGLRGKSILRKRQRNRFLRLRFPVLQVELTPKQGITYDGKTVVLEEKQDTLTVETCSSLTLFQK